VKAAVLRSPGAVESGPLAVEEVAAAPLRPGELRLRVEACAVCRTDLQIVEGELPAHKLPLVPGHQVVGRAIEVGSTVDRGLLGSRLGVGWLGSSCGRCRQCLSGLENLCPDATFTGWDHDGGYAEATVVDERFAYRLPDTLSDEQAAPLLCAGIIGYRSLRLTGLRHAGRLGLYGFGSSAHIAAQIAIAEGAEVYVATRAEAARNLATRLGAVWVGGATDRPPVPLDAAVLFAPAGELVPAALAALDRGGVLSVAGIHLSDIPVLDYEEHLFQERVLRSVTANTRRDGEELLALAPRLGVEVEVTTYPIDRADQALGDLAHDRLVGSAVLIR